MLSTGFVLISMVTYLYRENTPRFIEIIIKVRQNFNEKNRFFSWKPWNRFPCVSVTIKKKQLFFPSTSFDSLGFVFHSKFLKLSISNDITCIKLQWVYDVW